MPATVSLNSVASNVTNAPPVGGDDDAVEPVHGIVQASCPPALAELRQPRVGSDVLELVDEATIGVAEQGGLDDAGAGRPRPASRRSTARRRWRSARSRRRRGDGEQGAAELGVAGFGRQQPAEADQLTLGGVVRPDGGDVLEVVTGVDRRRGPVLRALVTVPILTTMALLSPSVRTT